MNITLFQNDTPLVALATDEPIADVPCGSCSLCCSRLAPFLTVEEIGSGAYPMSFVFHPDSPNAPVISMYRAPDGGCWAYRGGVCTIYETRPLACRQFDCRRGHHPSIPNMVDK